MKKIKYIWAIALIIAGLLITSAAGYSLENNKSGDILTISEKINSKRQSSLDDEELSYYTGASPEYVWGGGSSLMELAVRFTPDELGSVNECSLFQVIFFHGVGNDETPEPHQGTIVIYDEGSETTPGSVLTTEEFDTGEVYDWIYIDLSNPVTIDATKDIWVSVQIQDTGNHCFGVGSPPGVDQKSMFLKEEGVWKQLTDLNPEYSFDWFIGAFVTGEGTGTELKITDPVGPIGITTGVKNIGDNTAENMSYKMTITGGILNRVDVNISDDDIQLAASGEEELFSGIFLGFGSIDITVTANADNAEAVRCKKSGFLLGFLVLGIS